MAEKIKMDYTNSAENLCNPPEVGLKIAELQGAENDIDALEARLSENETYKLFKAAQKRVTDIMAQIKDMVDAQGSYQDLVSGYYAVKYRRMSKSYHVEPFLKAYPKYVPAVIEQTINVKVLEGFIKGKIIAEGELKDTGVITETPTYAYYIR